MLRAWWVDLLRSLRSDTDHMPVGDLRLLIVDVLGLVGVGSMVMVLLGLLVVPVVSQTTLMVAAVLGLAPLALRWLVQRAPTAVTVPGLLIGWTGVGVLWVIAVGSLQAVQTSLLLLPLMYATVVYGPRLGLLAAALLGLALFWLAYGLPNPQRIGSIDPYNQAWVLTDLAFVTVLGMIGLRRHLARAQREAADAQARRREDEQTLLLTQRLHMAIQVSQCGVWEFDVGTRLFTIDAQHARLYGVSPDTGSVSMAQWRRSVYRDDFRRVESEFLNVVHNGRSYDLTFRIRWPDGSLRWVRSLGQARTDAQGRVTHVVGLDRDVTEQEEGARALRESGERLSMAVTVAGGVAWVVTGPERRLLWNSRGLDIYGVDLLADPDAWLDVVLPEDRQRAAAAWQAALADGAPADFEFEFRIRHPARGLRHLRCVGRCEHAAQGRLVRAVGIDIDISAQRETTVRIAELSERLALAAAASGMGTWQLDLREGGIAWDERQAALYGLPAAPCQVDTARWAQWVAPDDRPALRAVIDGHAERAEWTLVPPPGEAHGRRLRTMAQTVHDAQGHALRRVGASFDITAEWQAQQAIERARAEAEQSSRAKSAFLANMSHEIRTPMNAVIGLTGLLIETVGPGKAHQQAAQAHSAARGLLAVLNDVLDVSKIEAGKLGLERSRFAIDEVFALVRDTLAHDAEAKGLALKVELDPALPDHWLGDRVRLQQILLNLASNAVKFTPRGAVCLRARLASDGRSLRCEVEDTGIGMDRATTARIFEAFEQGDVSTSRRYGGSGLGLTISRHLVSMMGGELQLRSSPGVGTLFWFELAWPEPVTEPPDADPDSGRARLERLHGARVLLVEDNELNRIVAQEMLRRLGTHVLLAASGAEALSLLRSQPVDAVLMDIQMPGMDGLETTRRIRAMDGPVAAVPVIAMTANAMAGDRERSLAAGMNDHVTKPIDRTALGEVLAQWLPE